jgi:hypothetical protein|tara:strand:- start:2683 stop:2883 length:201 start_codon:yes stop_codon:yes gene_type:complete
LPSDNTKKDTVDPEGARIRQEELDVMIKDFLAKGGKIERIPTGMTSEQYKEMKAEKASKKKKKVSK